MFRFKVSKFKNAAPKIPKREQCFTDVPVGTLMNSCGNHIAASCKFVAFNSELGGGHGVGVLGLEDYGRQQRTMPIIHGHSDFVSDICFSPFNDCVLVTGSFDGDVKVWKLPDDGLQELMNNPAIHLPSSSRRIDSVLFHPCAENVLAVTSSNEVQIYDLVQSQLKYEVANESDDLPFQSMDWKSDGSLLVTSCRDTKLRIMDPRASAISAAAQGHPGVKDSRTVWLGNTDHILSTGFGSQRERTIGIWDVRNFKSQVANEQVDNAAGTLMPFYDVDTNMLLLASKGDSKIFFYEIAEKGAKVSLASSDNLETQSSGMARIPKLAVNVMAAEVNRLLQLTKNSIIPISYIVPRRSYNDFYPELFPDTASGEPSMTADHWFSGKNEPMKLISLDPKKNPRKAVTKAKPEPEKPAQQKVDTPKPQQTKQVKVEQKAAAPPKKVEQPKAAAPAKVSPKASPKASPKTEPKHSEPKQPVAKFQKFRVSKFKHLTGKPLHKSHNIENVQKFDQSLSHESDGLQAYNDLVAYPIAGPGGQIAVVKLSNPGRLPDTGVPVLENPSALLDFAMDPFDNHLIAAGCEDSVVRIWRVPEEGLLETLSEPAAELTGHCAKVNIVRYHPCASGVLATASYDCDVKIWDVNSGSEMYTLEQHPEPLLAMAWHPDGHLLATIARDMKLRVYNPRKSTQPIQVGDGPPGPRGARIVWGGPDCNWLVVSGFSKAGFRGLYVYDSKDLSQAVASMELEPSPATLMLFYDEGSSTVFATGKGDRAVLAYEISSDPPHIFQLSSYTGPHQHQGIAFLRKDLCNVREIEFAKAVRVSKSIIEQVSFTVPRVKKNFFQDDIFPDARVTWEPSMTCAQWIKGANIPQRRLDLRPADMKPLHMAPEKAVTKKYGDSGTNVSDPKSAKQQGEDLMDQMMGKLADVDDGRPLEQDAMEGVDEDEWDD